MQFNFTTTILHLSTKSKQMPMFHPQIFVWIFSPPHWNPWLFSQRHANFLSCGRLLRSSHTVLLSWARFANCAEYSTVKTRTKYLISNLTDILWRRARTSLSSIRSPKIAHSTGALPWLSPIPLSSNCTRVSPQPPDDFVFPCHNGPFAIGLANRLFETTEENVVCRHLRRPKNIFTYEIDCASILLNPELMVFLCLLQPKLPRPYA